MKSKNERKTGECADLKVRFKFAKNISIVKLLDVSESLVGSDPDKVMQIQTLSDK